MRTIEKETTQASTADIDHAWDNSNNGGVAWYVNASAQAGTANLCILHNDGTAKVAQSDAVAADDPTVIVYDFPISKAIFRWTPGGTTSSVLTSRITPKPAR
jgi:hypothetical protein